MSGPVLRTEAARDEIVSALPGPVRAVYNYVAQHHFSGLAAIAKALKISDRDADAALRALARETLVESMTKPGVGVLWRPSPCAIEEKVKPGERPAPEPQPWYASELQGALQDARHPLYAEARALFVDALAGLESDDWAGIIQDVDERRRAAVEAEAGDGESAE